MPAAPDPGAPPGPGVDAVGRAVVDPTANVLDLVAAANRRQDDLREAFERHIHDLLELRTAHVTDLRDAEAKRIDAIREVDSAAVQRAADVAASVADTLAKQVASTAEASRVAQATALAPLTSAIEDLRRAQYEAQGQKSLVIDRREGGRSNALWLGLAVAAFSGLVGLVGLMVTIVVLLVA